MSIYDDPSAWVEIACRFCHSVFSIYEPTDEQLRGYICDDCTESATREETETYVR
jgi:hypothetical protein